MKEQFPEEGIAGQEVSEQEAIDLLLEAGPRQKMPPELAAQVRSRVEEAWLETVEVRRSRRRQLWAAAAVVSMVLGGAFFGLYQVPESSMVATLTAITPGDSSSLDLGFAVGDSLPAGTRLSTASGQRVVLRLNSGATVRLDQASEAWFPSPLAVELRRGAVYIDSGPGGRSLAVSTHLGVVQDIGTKFEVRLLSGGLRVQVREGEVTLEVAGQPHRATAGTVLELRGETVSRREIEAHGAAWAWLASVPQPFVLEGSTLRAFLDWVVSETGLELHFAEEGLEAEVREVIAHGALAGLTPDQALDIVLASSGLSFRRQGGELWIGRLTSSL